MQQELLNALYIRDGREDPEHPFHHVYTGLGIKYYRVFEELKAGWAND